MDSQMNSVVEEVLASVKSWEALVKENRCFKNRTRINEVYIGLLNFLPCDKLPYGIEPLSL